MSNLQQMFIYSCNTLNLDHDQVLNLSDTEWETVTSCFNFNMEEAVRTGFYNGSWFRCRFWKSDCMNMISLYRQFYKISEWLMNKGLYSSSSEIEMLYFDSCKSINLFPFRIFTIPEIEKLADDCIKRQKLHQSKAGEVLYYLMYFASDNQSIKDETSANEFYLEAYLEEFKSNLFKQLTEDAILHSPALTKFEVNTVSNIDRLFDDLQNILSPSSRTSLAEQQIDEQKFNVYVKAKLENFQEQLLDGLHKLVNEEPALSDDKIIIDLTSIYNQFHQTLIEEIRNLVATRNEEKIVNNPLDHGDFMVGLFNDLLTFYDALTSYAEEYENPDLKVSNEEISQDFYKVRDVLDHTLNGYGLSPLPIEIGEFIDRRKHNVIGVVQPNIEENKIPGTIAEVVRPGYVWEEMLVYPALVKIYSSVLAKQLDRHQ